MLQVVREALSDKLNQKEPAESESGSWSREREEQTHTLRGVDRLESGSLTSAELCSAMLLWDPG